MKCHVCGANMRLIATDLPFKVGQNAIVVLKELPVLHCENCQEYLIEDPVMEKIHSILDKADTTVELEVIRFAA